MKSISKYFKARKRQGEKVIKASVPKDKWDLVREYGMFRGCPSTQVEDALVSFAFDTAYEEAKQHENDSEFREWKQQREWRGTGLSGTPSLETAKEIS